MTERFQQNKALFRRFTAIDGEIKNHIFMAVQPVFLSALVDQLAGFGQVNALQMLQRFFNYYGEIDEIDIKENAVKMMRPYNPI